MTFNNKKDIKKYNNHLIKVYEELNALPKEEILLIIGWILIDEKIKCSEVLKHWEDRFVSSNSNLGKKYI